MLVLTAIWCVAMAFAPVSQQYPGLEWNKKSTLSTDRQVEFPGVVVEPGTYIIRLKESGEKRSTVEILNQEETQLLATFIAVPDHRVRPDNSSEFTFHEIKRGGPQPIQSWFYTGDLVGLEFVYPKPRAKEIAKDSDGHVMASNGSKDGVIVAVTANGREIVIDEEPTQTARRKAQ
jgi:hypothetical protein